MALNPYTQQPLSVIEDSIEACKKRIEQLYGTNYQKLRVREFTTKGFFPFTQKKQFEVFYVPLPIETRKSFQGMAPSPQMDFNTEKSKILEANQGTQNPQMKLILDEIKELRSKFDEKAVAPRSDEHTTITEIEHLLLRNDFTAEYIHKIIERIKKEFSLDDLDDFELVQKGVVDWIGETILIADTSKIARPEIIVLVGPTGIGKTTTVAKLGAYYSGFGNSNMPKDLNILPITIDNMRVGAKEQLEILGSAMGLSAEYADSAEDLHKVLAVQGAEKDVILIDTAGHSPKDYESLAKLRKTLELKGRKPRIFLTVSASTKANDLRIILQQYEIFGYDSIIITKLDETDTIGSIVSILDEKKKSIAYITNGQKIAYNFSKADQVSLLINLSDFEIDRAHIDEKFIQEKIG